MEDGLFGFNGTLLVCTRIPGQFQNNKRSKGVKCANVVKQAVYFVRKGPSFTIAMETVDNYAPREVDKTHPGCPNRETIIPKLL